MNETIFWLIISLFNWDNAGDDEAVIEPAIAELSNKSEREILQFQEILAEKLYSLDTITHAKEIGEEAYVNEDKYFSPDWFLYARCVVVANGKELYNEVLRNPRSFPKELEFESLLYVAPSAYKRKTGKEYNHVTQLSYETYSNKAGWK